MKTALVIGATGLVGSHIVQQLLLDDRYIKVKVFSRKTIDLNHDKLEQINTDFEKLELVAPEISGDDLYIAMGTTLKKAGSKEKQFKIDHNYPLNFAGIAKSNKVTKASVVSAAGANKSSKSFYMQMKHQLDVDIIDLGFDKTTFVKPSVIKGNRNEFRLGESFALKTMALLKYIPGADKFQPSPAIEIAACMIKATNDDTLKKVNEFEWDHIMKYNSMA